MKHAVRFAMILVTGFWAVMTPEVSAGTGGHGGGRGHGSGHGGGHSSSGHASGHAKGAGVGHSIAHFFGWHGKSAGSQPPVTSAARAEHGMVPQSASNVIFPSMSGSLHRRQGEAFIFGQPFLLPHRRSFGFGGCAAYGSPANSFFFGNGWNCFNSGIFFFDPFSFGFASSSWYGSPGWSGYGSIGPTEAPLPVSPGESDSVDMNGANAEGNESQERAKRESPVTLLQLRDGSMYGLTEYWVEGENLHYFTTYGGEDSVPIQHIDFEMTVKLNADRGVEFVLRPKPAAAPH
jgi:hypothetical protein